MFDGVVTQKTKIIPYSFHQIRQQLIKTSQFNSNHSTKESAPTDAFTLAAQKAAAKRQEAQDETGRARRSESPMGPWETWEKPREKGEARNASDFDADFDAYVLVFYRVVADHNWGDLLT